ncbi:hypothetical protein SDC9_157272 [bioreactor metagenome]|uniref:Uncharacterized protein n=1 Tax=bioreactor metagenome TaxID=1076179 RepID=A0A645F9H5_9ZZZZ
MDESPEAAALVRRAIGEAGRVVDGDAAHTGLPAASADAVIGEALLTMQTDRGKTAIIDEAVEAARQQAERAALAEQRARAQRRRTNKQPPDSDE